MANAPIHIGGIANIYGSYLAGQQQREDELLKQQLAQQDQDMLFEYRRAQIKRWKDTQKLEEDEQAFRQSQAKTKAAQAGKMDIKEFMTLPPQVQDAYMQQGMNIPPELQHMQGRFGEQLELQAGPEGQLTGDFQSVPGLSFAEPETPEQGPTPGQIIDDINRGGGLWGEPGTGAVADFYGIDDPYAGLGKTVTQMGQQGIAERAHASKVAQVTRDIFAAIKQGNVTREDAPKLGRMVWQTYKRNGWIDQDAPEPNWAAMPDRLTTTEYYNFMFRTAGQELQRSRAQFAFDVYIANSQDPDRAYRSPPAAARLPGPTGPVNPFALPGIGIEPPSGVPPEFGGPPSTGAAVLPGRAKLPPAKAAKPKTYGPPSRVQQALTGEQRKEAANLGFSDRAMRYGPVEVLRNLWSKTVDKKGKEKWVKGASPSQVKKISAKYKDRGILYQGENFGLSPGAIQTIIADLQREIGRGHKGGKLAPALRQDLASAGVRSGLIEMAAIKLMSTYYHRDVAY